MTSTLSPSYIKGVVVAFIVFVASDLLWHAVLMADFYNMHVAAVNGVAGPTVSVPASLILMEIAGALGGTYFIQLALPPRSKVMTGMWKGALLGLLMIGAVNAVGHGVILKWDLTLSLVDTGWGIVTGALMGAAVGAVTKH